MNVPRYATFSIDALLLWYHYGALDLQSSVGHYQGCWEPPLRPLPLVEPPLGLRCCALDLHIPWLGHHALNGSIAPSTVAPPPCPRFVALSRATTGMLGAATMPSVISRAKFTFVVTLGQVRVHYVP